MQWQPNDPLDEEALADDVPFDTAEQNELIALPRPHWAGEPTHTIQVGEQTLLLWSPARIIAADIPPRGWLLGTSFCRKFISGLIGPGSVGKTAVRSAQILALATGRAITGERVHHRSRVLLVGLEDDLAEMARRLMATMRHHGVDPAETEGWIYYFCPRGQHLMEPTQNGAAAPAALYATLRAVIKTISPALVCIDPFIKAAGVNENDNNLIDQVCILLANLADEFDLAQDLSSHVRKGSATPGDADQDRGASAKRDAGRLMRTLTVMSEAEAVAYEIKPTDRRSYVRLDDAKLNITQHGQEMWFRLASNEIGNRTDEYPNGDSVQAAERWYPPKVFDGVSIAVACQIFDEIEAGLPNGQRYSASGAAKSRAAWKVVKKHLPNKPDAQCRKVITGWKLAEVLIERDYHNDERRENESGLFANPAKRPGTAHE
jgi:hypothetical protein